MKQNLLMLLGMAFCVFALGMALASTFGLLP
ncbi:hypothetical protein SAMN05428995_102257 [Loktanella sp. DSM 29012]|nr:hypothetical protein SAMN05428995_102257 [Loktanella sp. DSM 29012]